MLSDAELDARRAFALDLAIEAGALIVPARGAGAIETATKSTATDFVTATDRAVERLIVERLRAAYPGDGILGEEGAAVEGRSGLRWLVDPIDGTTNFVYGLPPFAVSIGLEEDGRGLVGVVRDVAHDQTFSAAAGRGAYLDERRIEVTGLTDLATALVGTGFGYEVEVRRRQAEVLRGVLPRVRDIRRHGAAAVDLCWVACGRLDAYYEWGVQPWDVAAGAVIVREAGGRYARLDAPDGARRTVVAANPALFEPLSALLIEAGAA